MASHRFFTVDVFTERRFGGNPLAVFPDAAGLSDAQMQSLAREFNLSETTFVLPPDDPAHSARVRIFNPQAEMPFAGHPNVGTGYVLAQLGRDREGSLVFEEIAGLVSVRVTRRGDSKNSSRAIEQVTIDAPRPLSTGIELPAEAIAACASLDSSEIVMSSHPPIQASMGNSFVIAQVSGEALTKAAPDIAAFRNVVAQLPAPNSRFPLYLYAAEGNEIRARMFSPLSGVFEDPATGSAAAPLGGLLLSLSGASVAEYRVHQGAEMGRPSLLMVSAVRVADGIRASVGGACVPVLQGEAEL